MIEDGTFGADGARSFLQTGITLSRIGRHVPAPSSYLPSATAIAAIGEQLAESRILSDSGPSL